MAGKHVSYIDLLPYATESQARCIHALEEHKSQRKAAESLGINQRTLDEEFEETLERIITVALWNCDGSDEDIEMFNIQNKPTIKRLTKGWLSCKEESPTGYARHLCYHNLGFTYSPDSFNQIAELHFALLNEYYHTMVTYINKSLSGLI